VSQERDPWPVPGNLIVWRPACQKCLAQSSFLETTSETADFTSLPGTGIPDTTSRKDNVPVSTVVCDYFPITPSVAKARIHIPGSDAETIRPFVPEDVDRMPILQMAHRRLRQLLRKLRRIIGRLIFQSHHLRRCRRRPASA
jgi:hypothetical protein